MNTDIAGDMPYEQLESASEEARAVFNGEVPGNRFFNGMPATYTLGVECPPEKPSYPWMSYQRHDLLRLKEVLRGDWHEYIPKDEWKRHEKYWKGCEDDIIFGHDMAFLFPQHGIALITNPYFFKDHPNGEERLRGLGYIPIEKRGKNYSDAWCNENRLEVLRAMRNPEIGIQATDVRAQKIVFALLSNLPGAESYIFGIFTPKQRKRKTMGEDMFGYPMLQEGELVVRPVKELVEVTRGCAIDELENSLKDLPLSRAIGMTSLIQTSEGTRHIPMIDFACPDISDVHETLNRLEIPGIVVSSGKSYHFYGFDMRDEQGWKDHMESIRYAKGVCTHWPDLQLAQGYSMLRLTPAKEKLYQPCFVEYYPPEERGRNALEVTEVLSMEEIRRTAPEVPRVLAMAA